MELENYNNSMLLLEDLPELKRIKMNTVCVRKYWKSIFYTNDAVEMKFPLNQKVFFFAFSIAEVNADVE